MQMHNYFHTEIKVKSKAKFKPANRLPSWASTQAIWDENRQQLKFDTTSCRFLSRHFWREHRPVMKHGKISSSEQNRYCNIQPSELESRNEANKTLFHAWNKRPKEGTEQGKLISRCQFNFYL